ncbi:MAG: MBL fold metallo-hydrolase [Endomicrobiia bacterium]|jgi:glyoxylase-like metal-dependent hydrolase (beta-lactamase superfamily II)|nr:MBL fold metallo-hydrolase [Endomicrobiaceae bacterium]MDD3053240.1 MBL fold metallo-hydrolase [Endomicrobiaceae bacterium]MDD3922505.1 MBL fold metallo-hydrolase [Endomicrobiaceae bacterium]
MIKVDYVISGELEVNCYFVYDDITQKAIIIDPGQDDETVINKINALNLKPELLINTHGHFDHILADDIIRKKYNIPLAIHKIDLPMLLDSSENASTMIGIPTEIKPAEILFDKEEEKEASFCKYSIIYTPGHTHGSICILMNEFLFSGDTLFCGSIGRTDLPGGGNYQEIIQSLNKLKKLNKKIIVYPGHGPSSTIEQELLNNPFLR